MDPLDVTHGVLHCWRAGVKGRLGVGAPARSKHQAFEFHFLHVEGLHVYQSSPIASVSAISID